MKLLQVTILCLLSSLCSSDNDIDNQHLITPGPPKSISTAETFVPTTKPTSSPNLTKSTSLIGTTNMESSQTLPLTTHSSLTTTAKGEGAKTSGATKNEFNTTKETMTDHLFSNVVSTSQSFQHKTENQNSIKTTKRPVTSSQPDVSPSATSISPSVPTAIIGNISQSQGTENAKNVSSSSTSPSYSSIILPVVIALIVITLSAFALVGLYRMCRKTDPGTPENGNEQPQSDKESVKLLTVKTISHECGEHSAQGKTKN
ncbi:endomucin [Rhinolophus ferrumequinum]|uniref:Endomucin n=1 Tax=Rhinolophus ferrumequinum TaxID=59479 RepID=A0A671DWG9_RHIFE|nr:endomucin isoform X2 [Rhinolophus ferrumequinum]KAF6371654.1 endomucin [Rhinolophus ferrumequinum]